MSIITEQGTLVIGVKFGGEVHKDFELRPEMIKDVIDLELEGETKSDLKKTLFMLSRELVRLGTLDKKDITPGLLETITSVDFNILMEARSRLAGRLASFRGGPEAKKKDGAGPA